MRVLSVAVYAYRLGGEDVGDLMPVMDMGDPALGSPKGVTPPLPTAGRIRGPGGAKGLFRLLLRRRLAGPADLLAFRCCDCFSTPRVTNVSMSDDLRVGDCCCCCCCCFSKDALIGSSIGTAEPPRTGPGGDLLRCPGTYPTEPVRCWRLPLVGRLPLAGRCGDGQNSGAEITAGGTQSSHKPELVVSHRICRSGESKECGKLVKVKVPGAGGKGQGWLPLGPRKGWDGEGKPNEWLREAPEGRRQLGQAGLTCKKKKQEGTG